MPTLTELRQSPHHSYSSLSSFLSICPLQYAFRYIYKLEPERTGVSLPFGSAFHGALSWLANRRKAGDHAKAEELAEVFTEQWKVESKRTVGLKFKTDGEWDELNALGRKMVAAFHEGWSEEEEVVQVARAFSVPIIDADGEPVSGKPLIGEIDLIVKDKDGDTVLVDWKTSAAKWPEGKVHSHMQATCFTYGWSRLTGDNPLFRFDVVTKTKKPSYETLATTRREDDFNRLAELVRVVERAIAHDVFHPMHGGYACKDCPHSSACANWHRNQARYLPLAA